VIFFIPAAFEQADIESRYREIGKVKKKSLVWDQALKAPLKEETGECSDESPN